MTTLRSLSLALALPLIVAGLTPASPITYAFTGTLDTPIKVLDGASQFNGTFTINGDPTLSYSYSAGALTVNEGGNDVAVNLKIGGHSFSFTNPPDGLTSASFYAGPSGPSATSEDVIGISGDNQHANSQIYYYMNFYNPASIDNLSDLRTLKFNLGTGGSYITFNLDTPDGYAGGGHITSIELVSTPEPSTLAVFAVLGVAVMWRRRRS